MRRPRPISFTRTASHELRVADLRSGCPFTSRDHQDLKLSDVHAWPSEETKKEKKKTSPHFQRWSRSRMRREKAPTSLKHAQLRRLNVHLFALGRPYGNGQCPGALVTRSALRNGILGGWLDEQKSPVTKPATMWFWCNTSDVTIQGKNKQHKIRPMYVI